jgi:nitroimidazol reductase NimA-like FMN-containing flavoprotein (pyridoxamine 5'-phosphate oxidase superfamily)
MRSKIKEKQFILRWLKIHKHCVIATSKNNIPWAATVDYSVDNNFDIYIFTNPNSLKYKNIKKSPVVCLVIDSQNREGTLQIQGKANTRFSRKRDSYNLLIKPTFIIYRRKNKKGKQTKIELKLE